MKNSSEVHHPPSTRVARASGKQRAPAGLSKAARLWWRKLVEEYEIDDPGGLLVLETALRAFDRMMEARERLDAEGLTLKDRFGQAKPQPCAVIERDSRSAMLAALRALNLDTEPLNDRPGRPVGR